MRENSLGAAGGGADVEFLLFLSSRRFLPARSLAFSNVCTDQRLAKAIVLPANKLTKPSSLFPFAYSLRIYVCRRQVPD